MEKNLTLSCADCGTQNCKFKDRTYPEFCLTTSLDPGDSGWALERYGEKMNHDVMSASAEVEYEGYGRLTRVEETMLFARKINARKIGIAFCIGLVNEARTFARILRANGFEVYAAICKVEGRAKSSVGIAKDCEEIGPSMCNPILQARLLNKAGTDLNVTIGLCVGHDSLFYRYSDAYVTTLVAKDRVTGHNPAAPLYTSGSYYRKKLFPEYYLRPAYPEDIDSIMALFRKTVMDICTQDYTSEEAADWASCGEDREKWLGYLDTYHFTVAADKDRNIKGFAAVDGTGYLHLMFTAADCQRRGIGKKLFEEALTWCHHRGAEEMTADASLTSEGFFHRMGFSTVREQRRIARKFELKNLHMSRPVK